MKAAVVTKFGPPSVLALRDVEKPSPLPPLADAARAHERGEAGRTTGKLALIP